MVEYAPIAKALCTLDASTEKRLRGKFEIAYFLCKENMPFTTTNGSHLSVRGKSWCGLGAWI